VPIYEFECVCGNKLEKLFKTPVETIECPSCNRKMTRVLSASNFQLKGKCWAKDNYGLKEGKKKSNTKIDKKQ